MNLRYSFFVMVTLLAVSLLFAASSQARIDPQIIAGMWLFDDDEGGIATDSSGNGNDGTLKNGADWDDGKFGSAMRFDGGSSYVDCGNKASLDLPKEITVIAWVRFDAVDYKKGSGGLFTIAAKGYPDALTPHAGWWFSHDNRNNGQTFNYTCFGNKKGGWAGGGNNFGACRFQFTKKEWYHVAFTVGKSIARLYINGEQVGADKPLANLVLSDTTKNLTIGGAGNNYCFNGLIDEFAILSVELEKDQIQTIMNDGLERSFGLVSVDAKGKLAATWASIKSR